MRLRSGEVYGEEECTARCNAVRNAIEVDIERLLDALEFDEIGAFLTNHPPTKQHEEVLYGAVESAIEHAGNVKDDISYNVGDRLDDFLAELRANATTCCCKDSEKKYLKLVRKPAQNAFDAAAEAFFCYITRGRTLDDIEMDDNTPGIELVDVMPEYERADVADEMTTHED